MITIPTIKELYDSIINDLETSFGNNIPLFGKNFLRAMAGVQAAKLKIYYLAIGNLQKNIFVDTADPEAVGGTLERFGRVKLNRNPLPAVAGQYEIDVTGAISAVIPAGTVFKSDDDSTNPGKLFILDAQFTLLTTTGTITVRALEAGTNSKMNVGETMSSTVPLANVDRGAEVTAEVVEPLSAETLEAYRQKVIESFRTEPQGGSKADYILWASSVQGVRKCYPYAKSGFPAEINIFVEANKVDSIDGKGTPSLQILSEVGLVIEQDPDTSKSLEDRGRRPMGVFDVHELPVQPKDVVITIPGFEDLTTFKQNIIEQSLENLIFNIRPFIAGYDTLSNKNDILNINKISNAVLNASPGSIFGTITMTIDESPASVYTFNSNGEIPFLQDVIFS